MAEQAIFKGPTNSATRPRFSTAEPVALFLVAAVVSAGLIGIAECRSLLEDRYTADLGPRQKYEPNLFHKTGDNSVRYDHRYFNKRDAIFEEDVEEETEKPIEKPKILTNDLKVDALEGTTVNFPCKIEGDLEDFAVLWVNGTKSIMTDDQPNLADNRVKSGNSTDVLPPGVSDHSLVIVQVTRWDSGLYSCNVTSDPAVSITHQLHVLNPATVLSVKALGASKQDSKKVTVSQGQPVQLICNADGYPEPMVQWTKKAKYQQSQVAQPSDHDSNPSSSVPHSPATVVVSNTKEVRIESVSAHRDAGTYECSAHNSKSTAASRMSLDLEIEYQPDVVVPLHVINTGETYTIQLTCLVNAFPKPKVTWEKELITPTHVSWEPLPEQTSNGHYIIRMRPSVSPASNVVSNSTMPAGPSHTLTVKQVQSQDFGRYRCKAENRLGVSYSENITLTGSPAQPQSTYVESKKSDGTPELGWAVDSWSPLVEYQLQFKPQQDPLTSWTDAKPQPQVVDLTPGGGTGDEHHYKVVYVFSNDKQQLQPGTTYVAHLRARNVHGWSDWSTEVVFSGGNMNEITENGTAQEREQEKVLVAGTSSGTPSGLWQQSCSAAVMTAIVALVSVVVSASVY